MIIDPHIAITRFPDGGSGASFYDAFDARIRSRNEHPVGVLLYFAAAWDDEFHLFTVFRDTETMADSFARFSSVEAQNEMLDRGERFDIRRDEYRLERLYIDPEVRAEQTDDGSDGPIVRDSLVARTPEPLTMSLDEYRRLTSSVDWFSSSVHGRVAHLAYSDSDGNVHGCEIWREQSLAEAWYDANTKSVFEQMRPDTTVAAARDGAWRPLHICAVPPGEQSFADHYVREQPGPSVV